jgi:2,5-diketo-D-gluconate reductase B
MAEASFPRPGLGTWQNNDPTQCAASVETALETGYRHVDTARMYGNEAAVGEGIRNADVDRSEVTVATKLWLDELSPSDAEAAARDSLETLGLDHVDLLYVHWPARDYDPDVTLPALARLREEDVTREVGVCNMTPELLEEALRSAPCPVAAHQVEMHPLFPQEELVEMAADHDLDLVAYSPLARTRVGEEPAIREVAGRRDATPAQVALAWLMVWDHVVPIPKATGEDHIRENWEARELELTEEDHQRIAGIDRRERLVDPGFAPLWD